MIDDEGEWLPLKDAAARLGIGRDTLRGRRQLGRHKVKQIGSEYLYLVSSVEKSSRITNEEIIALLDDVESPAKIDGTYRILSLFDVHVPEADAWSFKAVIDFAKDSQPNHIVLGGDFLELESCSQHGGIASPNALVDDIKAGRKALDRLREACPSAAFTYLEGNHETRLNRTVASQLPTFDGALSLRELLRLDEMGCEWVPYRKLWTPPIPNAELAYTHGEWASLHHAKKHVEAYGMSVRYGHTHRPQTYSRSYGDGRIVVGIGTGCLRTLDPGWIGPNNGWTHGFGFDEFTPDGAVTAHNIVISRRRFAWGGKVYGKSVA